MFFWFSGNYWLSKIRFEFIDCQKLELPVAQDLIRDLLGIVFGLEQGSYCCQHAAAAQGCLEGVHALSLGNGSQPGKNVCIELRMQPA